MNVNEPAAPGPYVLEGANKAQDVKVPPQSPQLVATETPSGPSQPPPRIPALPQPAPYHGQPTTVYNYVNPVTGEHVASLLPPDHPQMICLQEGKHVPHTRFGILGAYSCVFISVLKATLTISVLGILAAVFWVPLGIACCLLDQRTRCQRCGMVLDEGLCG